MVMTQQGKGPTMKIAMLLVLVAWLSIMTGRVHGKEIGFAENFSLAEDREKVLEQLIPGTPDYYYFHCLHAQHTGDFPAVRRLLEKWIERHGYTDKVREIQNRQALLAYRRQPEKSLQHIRQTLNLRFDHQKESADRKADAPEALSPDLISIARLAPLALSRYRNLDGFEDTGLSILDSKRLTPDQRRNLLQRLKVPDHPGLVKMVVQDLRYKHSGGFGSLPIHQQLLKSQLDGCLKQMPALLNDTGFVKTYMIRLAPSDDTDIQYDPEEKAAYLDRLWAFVQTLSPAHNSLKVHVLYHMLDLNRSRGEYDRERFMAYLRLPRRVSYMDPDYLRRRELRNVGVDLNSDFSGATRLSAVGDDEELVRDYLSHFFVEADTYQPFAEYIRDDYLKRLFAETRILKGLGDMEQWYAMLTPDRNQTLKERVDLSFAPVNRKFFRTDEPVTLQLDVKNVENLIIKVYEINTFNYYQKQRSPVELGINLDGLVASSETVERYDVPPQRQVRRSYQFPRMDRPGVFVVEFIGGGKRSRALIRKGDLRAVSRISSAGHEFVILDDRNRLRPEATLWMDGREYTPDADGIITVPFSTRPGQQTIILRDGDFAALDRFAHQGEQYRLSAGFHVSRESLLRRREATVLVRPLLAVNHHPVDLSLLEDVRLDIRSVDQDGVATTRTVNNFELSEDRESSFTFPVPENLGQIEFSLRAKVKNLSRGKTDELSAESAFSVNRIDTTMMVQDLFLSHIDGIYWMEMLGRNGEPVSGRPVQVVLKHRYFRDQVHATLQSDADGRIRLGSLKEIDWIKVTGPDGASHTWHPVRDRCRYPEQIHAATGAPVRIPYMEALDGKDRRRFVLMEVRGNIPVADYTESVRYADGYLIVENVPAGDYQLVLKEEQEKILLRFSEGTAFEDVILSGHRILEQKDRNPVQIIRIDADADALHVRIGNPSPRTRLHLIATRFMPAFDLYEHLLRQGLPLPDEIRLTRPASRYLAERRIGDEYRYILNRKYAEKYPGNLLQRPELLLNPWAVRKTETAVDQAQAGEEMRMAEPELSRSVGSTYEKKSVPAADGSFSNLDFLDRTAVHLLNLKPDENGRITIPRSDLGDRPQIHLLAVDDRSTVYREYSLPLAEMPKRDLRMVSRLNPEHHYTEQKQVTTVLPGKPFRLADMTAGDFEVYDTVEKVYRLFETLSGDATLKTFDFILRWPQMTPAEKAEKYSEYACHELHVFLYHKDRPFFDTVVAPYLENKKDRTFLDRWLLNDDLSGYLDPWPFSRLNIVEKILLLRRTSDDGGRTSRYVKDLYDMLPPDPETFNRLFDTALKGRALEKDITGPADGSISMIEQLADDKVQAAGFAEMDDVMAEMDEGFAEMEEEIAMAPAAAAPPAPRAAAPPAGRRMFKAKREDRRRQEMRPLYRQMDKTEEWVENNYYKRPIEDQNADLITVNAFWTDFAASDPARPFYAGSFPFAHRNFPEMMLALSVLDLPFNAGKQTSTVEETAFSIQSASPMIVFHREIQPAEPADDPPPVLVTQNFFRPDDRYRYEDNERVDKFVRDELIYRTAYGCQVVLSNPTSSRQRLRILLQIPAGAIPLKNGFYSRSFPIVVEPYATWTTEYYFYFPRTGGFSIYPAHVAKAETFIANAESRTFRVVRTPGQVDTRSWAYLSQNGSPDAVLDDLRTRNLNRVDLEKIAFRMKDITFFRKTLELLRSRMVYHHTLWSYSIYHNIPEAMSEYLAHSPYAEQVGLYLDSALLEVEPVERHRYEHREYSPLVNARVHRLGERPRILNDRLYEQYSTFMTLLQYRPELTAEDRMAVVYYMLLQGRISEALQHFEKISPDAVGMRIQYDYLRTYVDLYTRNPASARRIASSYADYPVPRWRNLFRQALAQLDEIEGKSASVVDPESREQRMEALAATAPSFDFRIEDRRVVLTWRNIDSYRVNYYPMDIELLFSETPFVQQQSDQYAFIWPVHSETAGLPDEEHRSEVEFRLPEQFRNSNLIVEIAAAGIKKSRAHYAHSLDVQVVESYGYMDVAEQKTGRPLPGTYIKVYARLQDGTVRFYKDGYTDLRGRFDYISLSTDELDRVERFSVLVLSDEHGAVIREAAPPKR